MVFRHRTWEEKMLEIVARGWHSAFAWLPVRIDAKTVVWLGAYERRLIDRQDADKPPTDPNYRFVPEVRLPQPVQRGVVPPMVIPPPDPGPWPPPGETETGKAI